MPDTAQVSATRDIDVLKVLDSVTDLLAQAGYRDDSSVRHQLAIVKSILREKQSHERQSSVVPSSIEPAEPHGHWWCANCQKWVPPEAVTFQENHDARLDDGCGAPCVPFKPKELAPSHVAPRNLSEFVHAAPEEVREALGEEVVKGAIERQRANVAPSETYCDQQAVRRRLLQQPDAQSETGEISAVVSAHDLLLHGNYGVTGSIYGLTVHVDHDVPDGTIIIKDKLGRELGRINNVGL